MSIRGEVQRKGKTKDRSRSAWKTVLNVGGNDDPSQDYAGAEEQQVKLGTAPEDANDYMEAALQEMIADEIKQQVSMRLQLSWKPLKRLLSSSSGLQPTAHNVESALSYEILRNRPF